MDVSDVYSIFLYNKQFDTRTCMFNKYSIHHNDCRGIKLILKSLYEEVPIKHNSEMKNIQTSLKHCSSYQGFGYNNS